MREIKDTILVVEDEKALSAAIQRKLELSGFEIKVANSVAGALEIIENNPSVKAIWLDHYLLGKEDGLDLAIRLKGDERYKNIPIFIVSNTASHDKVKSYIELGIEKYYTKSDFSLAEIIADISATIKKEGQDE